MLTGQIVNAVQNVWLRLGGSRIYHNEKQEKKLSINRFRPKVLQAVYS